MAINTATSDNLDAAQNIVIATMRYTAEQNTPCLGLIEKFTLGKGDKQMTVPKLGAAPTFAALQDGVDLIDSKDLSITTTDLTTQEAGGKFIVTDKLVRQMSEDVFKMVGRQGGMAMAQMKDKAVIALFSGLNGGTSLGAAGNPLNLAQAVGCVAWAAKQLAPDPISVVHHPYPIMQLSKNAIGIGQTYFPGILTGLQETNLRRFFQVQINGVNFFWTGNVVPDASDDGVGAIFSKSAMCYVESQADRIERERDASLRATEIVFTSDYGVFELDDSYGAPMTYDCASPATTT